jgi:hypothetical protein
MKRNRRVVFYIALGLVCFGGAAVMVFIKRLQNTQVLGFSGLLFTIAIGLLLLAKITRLDSRVRGLEEFQRLQMSKGRARLHDASENEPEEAPPSQGG